jgi:hypothetical protein
MEHLSDTFCIESVLKQKDAFSPLHLISMLEYASKKFQEN